MYYILLEKSCWVESIYAIVAFNKKSSLVKALHCLDYIFKSKEIVLSQFVGDFCEQICWRLKLV